MKTNSYSDFFKEFEDYLRIEAISPDKKIGLSISKSVKNNLFIFKINTLLLMVAIHCVMGTFTLAICPQFHIHLFGNFMGLMTIFMKFGSNICSFLCGFLFLSLSLIIGSIILPQKSKNYLYRIRYYKISVLILITLFVFKLIGDINLDIKVFIWILGAFTGAYLAFLRFRGVAIRFSV